MNIDINKIAIAASCFLIGQSLNKPQLTRSSVGTDTGVTTATLSVLGPSGMTTILPLTNVSFTPGDTVLDITVKGLQANNIPFDISGSGRGAYITGINNLYQLDQGPLSGWLFSVDGRYPSQGPAALQLTQNSAIQWVYTTDLGNDVGAPSGILQRKWNNFRS